MAAGADRIGYGVPIGPTPDYDGDVLGPQQARFSRLAVGYHRSLGQKRENSVSDRFWFRIRFPPIQGDYLERGLVAFRACRGQRLIGRAEKARSKRVNEIHDPRIGTPVAIKALASIRKANLHGALQTRIGALKAHDRLLAVSDDQCARDRPCDAPEERELDRVGILKLVDDHTVELGSKAFEDRRIAGQKRV